MIPYSRQQITENDIAAVTRVLRSEFLTQGPATPAFEEAIARYCSVSESVAVSSATAALHISCLSLGVGPGDEVWTSPISFVASSNAALYCGANVDFVDIDRSTFNMSVKALKQKLAEASRRNRLPKVVIPVHMAGLPCAMKEIRELSFEYGFKVLEDASHALGARYLDSVIGDCRYSDAAVLSFHPVKMITTGEGGCILSRDLRLLNQVRLLRSHGISRDPQQLEKIDEGPWYYEQSQLGFNYRMTDIQAALGKSQLQRLTDFVTKRQILASRYDQAFEKTSIRHQRVGEDFQSSYHLYLVQLPDASQRRKIFDQLRERGYGVNVHYIPIHLQPYYRRLGFRPGMFPEAERYYSAALSLPLYPDLPDQEIDCVVSALKELL